MAKIVAHSCTLSMWGGRLRWEAHLERSRLRERELALRCGVFPFDDLSSWALVCTGVGLGSYQQDISASPSFICLYF